MAEIGLVIRPGVKEAINLAVKFLSWAKNSQHSVIVESESARLLNTPSVSYQILNAAELISQASPIVTLGGDGTLIGIARLVADKTPVMIGVNFGQLGFLTEIAPDELIDTVESVLAGKSRLGERGMLKVTVERDGLCLFASQAVNDAVVQKEARERLAGFDLSVDGQNVMRSRSDGLIISTPTGSTAYALSAGGPIVYPLLDVVLVTPICPHSLTNRPLILPSSSEVVISIPPYEGKLLLSVDGQESTDLKSGDKVVITRASHKVRFVRSASQTYFDILRSKLNWGRVYEG